MTDYFTAESPRSQSRSSTNFEQFPSTFADGEAGEPSPQVTDEAYWTTCSFFGRRFFEFILAGTGSRNAQTPNGLSELNRQLDELTVDFRFGQCLEKVTGMPEFENIPDFDRHKDQSRKDRLMTIIGAMTLHGDNATMRNLASIIHSCRAGSSKSRRHLFGLHGGVAGSPSPPYSDASDEHETILGDPVRPSRPARYGSLRQGVPYDEPRRGNYATRLKEYLDGRHEQMDDPPATMTHEDRVVWRKVIRVQGGTYEGCASTKKEAFHIACEKACHALQIG